jgi:hypothetical protein
LAYDRSDLDIFSNTGKLVTARRVQATRTGGLRAGITRVAGCARPTGSAGHAGVTANSQLTFHLGHSMQAGHFRLVDFIIKSSNCLFVLKGALLPYGLIRSCLWVDAGVT